MPPLPWVPEPEHISHWEQPYWIQPSLPRSFQPLALPPPPPANHHVAKRKNQIQEAAKQDATVRLERELKSLDAQYQNR